MNIAVILLIIKTVLIKLFYVVCFIWQETDKNNTLNLYTDAAKTQAWQMRYLTYPTSLHLFTISGGGVNFDFRQLQIT